MAVILSGCSSSDLCMQEMKVVLKVEFKEMKYDMSSEQYKEQSKYVNVIVHGVGIDSLLYDSTSLNSMELPLQINAENSRFVIKQYYENEVDTGYVADTIWVNHDNEVEFVSVECGGVMTHSINGVLWTINRIDSVVVDDPKVIRNGKNNLKIYLKKQ